MSKNQKRKPSPKKTYHRTRLDAEAWAAKQALESMEGLRVDDKPVRGTQAVVKWALLHSLGPRGGDEERDTLRQQVADQKLSIDRLEKDLKISRRLCTSLEQDREERDALRKKFEAAVKQRDELQKMLNDQKDWELAAHELDQEKSVMQQERDEYRQTSDAFQAAIQRHVNALLPAERAPAAELDGLTQVEHNATRWKQERDELTAQVEKGTAALKDCKASMASARETSVANERQLRKRYDTLRVELDEAKRGYPHWHVAGLVGIAVGAAAMLLLRLWGV